jgi:hypothetical protein
MWSLMICTPHPIEAYTGFWWGNLRERDRLEDPGLDGRIILRWGHGLDRAGSGQGQLAGTYDCGNEPSFSIKCGEFLD